MKSKCKVTLRHFNDVASISSRSWVGRDRTDMKLLVFSYLFTTRIMHICSKDHTKMARCGNEIKMMETARAYQI